EMVVDEAGKIDVAEGDERGRITPRDLLGVHPSALGVRLFSIGVIRRVNQVAVKRDGRVQTDQIHSAGAVFRRSTSLSRTLQTCVLSTVRIASLVCGGLPFRRFSQIQSVRVGARLRSSASSRSGMSSAGR